MAVAAPSTRTLTAGIAGSSGYAGRELMRLLSGHPQLRGVGCTADTRALADCDLALLALPHGASGELGRELASARLPVVDLAADFRGRWTYGLPELHRARIAESVAVAGPGCYATAAILALAPLVEVGALESHLIVDGKSGVSGAGKAPTEANVFCAAAEGMTVYTPVGHHHQQEIERELSLVAGVPQTVTFTPHLAPFSRGLLVTAYGRLRVPLEQGDLDRIFAERYDGERFVQIVDQPRTQDVRGCNVCRLRGWVDPSRGAVVVSAAIDNLVKGAAGQAVQCANLMLGLDEAAGLPEAGLWP